eukprot:Sdes_comp21954_c0_seq1m20497
MKLLVIDNGSGCLKSGWTNFQSDHVPSLPFLFPNAIMRNRTQKRNFVGIQIENCNDFSSLYYKRPFQKGYLTSPDVQKIIWDVIFKDLQVDFNETSFILTVPPYNFDSI